LCFYLIRDNQRKAGVIARLSLFARKSKKYFPSQQFHIPFTPVWVSGDDRQP
jgi:hypothetical protein